MFASPAAPVELITLYPNDVRALYTHLGNEGQTDEVELTPQEADELHEALAVANKYDSSNLLVPPEIASFTVPGAAPHPLVPFVGQRILEVRPRPDGEIARRKQVFGREDNLISALKLISSNEEKCIIRFPLMIPKLENVIGPLQLAQGRQIEAIILQMPEPAYVGRFQMTIDSWDPEQVEGKYINIFSLQHCS